MTARSPVACAPAASRTGRSRRCPKIVTQCLSNLLSAPFGTQTEWYPSTYGVPVSYNNLYITAAADLSELSQCSPLMRKAALYGTNPKWFYNRSGRNGNETVTPKPWHRRRTFNFLHHWLCISDQRKKLLLRVHHDLHGVKYNTSAQIPTK